MVPSSLTGVGSSLISVSPGPMAAAPSSTGQPGLLLVLLLQEDGLSLGVGGERPRDAGRLEILSGDDDLLLLEELG